ncbi:hypothetical protein [Amycolatopsis sp. NPDC102389]|uniref:hypothetical protein n=1 Tax=Amycolatopsis sp. NPDC102389 TaxID=3363941 RepID=UPI00382471AA
MSDNTMNDPSRLTHADAELRKIRSALMAWSAAIVDAGAMRVSDPERPAAWAKVADLADEAAALLRDKAKDLDRSARSWRQSTERNPDTHG